MSFEKCIHAARELVKDLMKSNDSSHDYAHVERVWKLACKIARDEPMANQIVVQLGALFHDVVDYKYDHGSSMSLEELAHFRLKTFFNENNISQELSEKILFIILNISWRKQLEGKLKQEDEFLELRIVRDAVRLESIGAIGIARCFTYNGAKNLPMYIENGSREMTCLSAKEYNEKTVANKGDAIGHFYEKLLLIKDKMTTRVGITLAKERHDFMLSFLKQFNNEINLK